MTICLIIKLSLIGEEEIKRHRSLFKITDGIITTPSFGVLTIFTTPLDIIGIGRLDTTIDGDGIASPGDITAPFTLLTPLTT